VADPDVGPQCRRWTITGRVQGVGFRWFALKEAQAMGVMGWVANTADGAVEAVGLATPETLDLFQAALAKGPPSSRVTRIVTENVPHDFVESKSFTIKH
jgi:acylphosphatase